MTYGKLSCASRLVREFYGLTGDDEGHTWNHIARIHSILVLDEAETVHKLDLGYFTSAVSSEMRFDILLGS
ncbi:hypothetical protein RRF57_001901 [Xylaria bambusicola]|uniref:Uncharacterized protein n=1 Tax=Xylaria bambusicola TaxID=326684 RepID=A0AAN7UJF7_9PEZI